ncbi:Stage II sporulation protein E (SpoIIE) [Thermanaeromonas toyohensis ToBE]|uniref:Stage II sporulation protein E (SpoIIE) n=2 Tax=Thermanaeromonas TaxID=202949 RepID=A0A1W1VX82_9FIRM|nr:Stage II sporulation protein E (SpoIIE) [Thermanaeromonas toyohensis ToBE]
MKLSSQDLHAHGWSLWSSWRPKAGYKVGGDLCYMFAAQNTLITSVIDVLGHGEEAHRCALELLNVMRKHEENLRILFAKLETTAARHRGCALFLGSFSGPVVTYIMVGNMRGWVFQEPGKIEVLYAQPGVVGARKLLPITREIRVRPNSTLWICSDGIRRSFVPSKEHLLISNEGMELAKGILKDYGIEEDDASILIGRRWGQS